MTYYVIRRVDQGGGWVTPPNSKRSYTQDVKEALHFKDRMRAVDQCCSNEVPEAVELEDHISVT